MLGKIIAFGFGVGIGVILSARYLYVPAPSTNRPKIVSWFDEKLGRWLRKLTTKRLVKKVPKFLCRQKNKNIKIDYHKTKGNSNKKQSFIPKIQLKRL
jgi:hypothetical protein